MLPRTNINFQNPKKTVEVSNVEIPGKVRENIHFSLSFQYLYVATSSLSRLAWPIDTSKTICDRQNNPSSSKDTHILSPGTCEYVILNGKWKTIDEVANQLILKEIVLV